jgi:alpha-mannosidase
VGEPTIIESGPIRWTVRLEGRWGKSRAWQDFSLTRGRKQVDVRLALDWHEKHRILKLRVPTRVREGEATFEIPYGAIVRPPTGDEQPAQRWVDLSGCAGGSRGEVPYGVALLNDSRYGFDVRGAEIRMSVLRSPIYAFHDPAQVVPDETYEYTDQGRHVVRYAIVPHHGTWREAAVVRRAAELNRPCLVLQEPAHDGPLPPSYAFAATDCPNVDVEVVKPAERGSDTIIRLRETSGRNASCRLLLAGSQTLDLSFRAWEIKTLALARSDGEWCAEETDLLERPLHDQQRHYWKEQ